MAKISNFDPENLRIHFGMAVQFAYWRDGKHLGSMRVSYPLARAIVALHKTVGQGRFSNSEATVDVADGTATIRLPKTPNDPDSALIRGDEDDLFKITIPVADLEDSFRYAHVHELCLDEDRVAALLEKIGDPILNPLAF